MKEVWVDVKGYEGLYKVSNKGNVKSLYREVLKSNGKTQIIIEKILKPQDSGHGYNRVNLYKNKKPKMITVHSIVLEAFTNKRENGKVINHIDGDKKNNNLNNLEWCTSKENTIHGFKTGLIEKGEKHSRAKLKEKEVLEIKRIYFKGKCSQRELAKKFGVSQNAIYCIINGKSWSWLNEEVV